MEEQEHRWANTHSFLAENPNLYRQTLYLQSYLNVSKQAETFVQHTKQQDTRCFLFLIQTRHGPLINHANLIRV